MLSTCTCCHRPLRQVTLLLCGCHVDLWLLSIFRYSGSLSGGAPLSVWLWLLRCQTRPVLELRTADPSTCARVSTPTATPQQSSDLFLCSGGPCSCWYRRGPLRRHLKHILHVSPNFLLHPSNVFFHSTCTEALQACDL